LLSSLGAVGGPFFALSNRAHSETGAVSNKNINSMSINILDFQRDIVAKAKTVKINGMDWDDVAQEINLHLLHNIQKYNPSKAGPRTFVVRVADNRIRDLARRANAQKRYLDNHSLSLEELTEQELVAAY
jgi:RNA polymerase sigma factor (sigma-70 family)